ncbi:hypothetical protein QR98_0063850 [Sarcoptes scabiei]|uniref:Uncharacterized protein n=1 Tax=Sarcoptes scabiei TaxID=52283 RepID=A0A132AAF1_SARSC|nr:hypothetical protein QR98_0063850 [Sarcoptes scabiei]
MFEQQDTIQMIENHRNHQRNDDPLEKVILGEAITLSTFMLRNNQRLSKANYVQLSCMTSSIIEHEDDEFDSDESFMIDPLLRSLVSLRSRLNHHKKEDLTHLDLTLIKPFCDVIVNKDVSGPVTGLALQAIKKFINYGLIKDDENVRLIAESVTKARFVGTDSNSDETRV